MKVSPFLFPQGTRHLFSHWVCVAEWSGRQSSVSGVEGSNLGRYLNTVFLGSLEIIALAAGSFLIDRLYISF
jgi:hypothetical protein